MVDISPHNCREMIGRLEAEDNGADMSLVSPVSGGKPGQR